MSFPTPGGDITRNDGTFDERPLRYDLDDLNGEIVLLDWGGVEGDPKPDVSPPNRHLPSFKLMNGSVNMIRIQEGNKADASPFLHHRMTLLDPRDHEFMKPLPKDYNDPIAQDLKDIPRICRAIQDDWRGFSKTTSLNRLTAWNFTKCLQKRMQSLRNGTIERRSGTIDIVSCFQEILHCSTLCSTYPIFSWLTFDCVVPF